ncbi:MAG: ankyrin repeat domain-containing protein [Chthonomonadales bacterium]
MSLKRMNVKRIVIGIVFFAIGVVVLVAGSHIWQDQLNKRLITSIHSGDDRAVARLLDVGADPNADVYIHLPTQSLKNNIQMEYLVRQNRTPIIQTPMEAACRSQKPEIVRLLLEKGANPNAIDMFQRTPLMLAIHYAGMMTLQRAGIQYRNFQFPGFQMMYTSQPLINNHDPREDEIIRLLLKYGANARYYSKQTTSALYWAASYGDAPAVGLLLAAGADPRLAGTSDILPICVALRQGSWDIAIALRDAMLKNRNSLAITYKP